MSQKKKLEQKSSIRKTPDEANKQANLNRKTIEAAIAKTEAEKKRSDELKAAQAAHSNPIPERDRLTPKPFICANRISWIFLII